MAVAPGIGERERGRITLASHTNANANTNIKTNSMAVQFYLISAQKDVLRQMSYQVQ